MSRRTIIALDESLHRRAKAFAARHGTTLAALVEEALRLRLSRPEQARRGPVTLPTFKGDGMQPGVTLDDMGTVYDRMDGLK
jgi:plasmid stability protein